MRVNLHTKRASQSTPGLDASGGLRPQMVGPEMLFFYGKFSLFFLGNVCWPMPVISAPGSRPRARAPWVMSGFMNVFMSGFMSAFISAFYEWLYECLYDWIYEWLHEWLYDCLYEWLYESLYEWL